MFHCYYTIVNLCDFAPKLEFYAQKETLPILSIDD